MSAISAREHLQELRLLVKRLEGEHRQLESELDALNRGVPAVGEVDRLRKGFIQLQDELTEHMLVEEFEVYPELMRKSLFDPAVSAIMQQHHDVTSGLGKMESALRLKNTAEFEAALAELACVLHLHQPAEEEKVFPIATS